MRKPGHIKKHELVKSNKISNIYFQQKKKGPLMLRRHALLCQDKSSVAQWRRKRAPESFMPPVYLTHWEDQSLLMEREAYWPCRKVQLVKNATACFRKVSGQNTCLEQRNSWEKRSELHQSSEFKGGKSTASQWRSYICRSSANNNSSLTSSHSSYSEASLLIAHGEAQPAYISSCHSNRKEKRST